MGNDYDARRRNKKLNKRAAQDAADADGKSKRQRTKGRPKVGGILLSRRCGEPCP